MAVLSQRPACMIAGSSMPYATMSCAAPTRVLCPDRRSTSSASILARLAIALQEPGRSTGWV